VQRIRKKSAARYSRSSHEKPAISGVIPIKRQAEIEAIRKAGRVVAGVLAMFEEIIRAGMRTKELDKMAEEFIYDNGAKPAFKGYRGFPANICVSVNSEVVHGIPGEYEIRDGDLVSVDVGAIVDDFYGDGAATYYVGEPAQEVKRFIETTRRALDEGISRMVSGNRVGDISNAVQRVVEGGGYSVVRDLVGHGIGRNMHEEPQIPNYGVAGTGPLIQDGMVFAIEPMVNMGRHGIRTLDDGWTVVATDGGLSCHFEHTVAAAPDGPQILTLPG